jgi:hypothetical protein
MRPAIVNKAREKQQYDNGYMQQNKFCQLLPVQQAWHQYRAIQVIQSYEKQEHPRLLYPIFLWKADPNRHWDMGYENKTQQRP